MSFSDYLDHLATGATTRALCWRVARTDGAVFGFTDHDAPITFDGVTYEPRAAFEGSELADTLGLGVDDQDVTGALSSERIKAGDLMRGVYDGARVSIYDVNWEDPAGRALHGEFLIGEVERGEIAFRAELRSTVGPLSSKAGARYIPECAAVVGDGRCRVDLTAGANHAVGTVTALALDGFSASGLSDHALGWFNRGVLTWTSGGNAGAQSEVRSHTARAVSLWRSPPFPIAVGDRFSVTAGCDKTYATCKAKFLNGINFRGFPQMPGEGFAAEYAVTGDPDLDGGSRNG